MSFDSRGYLLTADDGPQLWLLDTRMNIKVAARKPAVRSPSSSGPRRPASARLCTSMASMTRGSTSSTARSASSVGTSTSPPGPETSRSCHAAFRTPSSSLAAPYAACRSTRRPGSKTSSPRLAAPPSGRACPNPANPTSRAWPRPGSATATRSSARRWRRHGDPPPFHALQSRLKSVNRTVRLAGHWSLVTGLCTWPMRAMECFS